MLNWKVKYYEGKLPLREISSFDESWENLPKKNVVEIEITKDDKKHMLRGYDFYWINDYEYGMFNNVGEQALIDENNRLENNHQEVIYVGKSAVAYDWKNENVYVGENFPVNGVYILEGIMLDDNTAKTLKLI